MRAGTAHILTEKKPALITGKISSHYRDPVHITGNLFLKQALPYTPRPLLYPVRDCSVIWGKNWGGGKYPPCPLVPPALAGIASLYSNVIFLSKRRSRVDRFRNMHGCTTQPLKQPCSPAQAEGHP